MVAGVPSNDGIDVDKLHESYLLAEEDRQFDKMNIGLHRRTSPKLGAPSLIWHRCFWRPSAPHDEKNASAEIDQSQDSLLDEYWHGSIANFLYNLHVGLQCLAIERGTSLKCPNFYKGKLETFDRIWTIKGSDIDSLESARRNPEPFDLYEPSFRSVSNSIDEKDRFFHDTFSCDIGIYSAKFKFRAVMQSEFWTFTVFCDLSSFDPSNIPEDASGDEIDLTNLYNIFIELHEQIESRYNETDWNKHKSETPTTVIEDFDNKLDAYDGLVLRFQNFIDRFVIKLSDQNAISGLPALPGIGRLFGSFVGVVFGLSPSGKKKSFIDGHSPRLPLKRVSNWEPTRPIPERVSPSAAMDSDDALHLVDASWSVMKNLFGWKIKNDRPTPAGDAFDDSKQDGGALDRPEKKQIRPKVQFFSPKKGEVTISLFQRKRVLYASALGRESLRKSGPVVYTIICAHAGRWQLGRVIDRIHELGAMRLAAVRDFSKIYEAGVELNRLRTDLANKVSSPQSIGSRLDSIERSIPRGFERRLERSRYYISRFRDICKSLEIDRVEGYEKYDNFVERRLSDKFGTIDYVSRIYDATNKAHRAALNGSIQDGISDQISEARHLLTTAEIISVLPVTYYMGGIFSHISEAYELQPIDLLRPIFVNAEIISYLFAFLIVISVIWLRRRRKRNALKRALRGDSAHKPALSSRFDLNPPDRLA